MVVTGSGMACVFIKASYKHGSFTDSVRQSVFASVRPPLEIAVKESVIGVAFSKVFVLY